MILRRCWPLLAILVNSEYIFWPEHSPKCSLQEWLSYMAQTQITLPKPGLKQEALAVLGIFVSLFLYLSLISYSLKTNGNWCGEIGT